MLKVKNLCKKYPAFELKNVSFEIKEGSIVGFIGVNGSGKSTTLKSMLNIVHADSGEVEILGKNIQEHEIDIKQEIGFMLGPVDYYSKTKIKKVAEVYKSFYERWDDEKYKSFLTRFNLDDNKKISELSAGMKVKLGIALALSHNAKVLILDEPTSGLDPIARDELLDLFRDLIEEGGRALLFSTHITSDLDKCADYILFIRNGEIIANTTKDSLIKEHVFIAGSFSEELKERMIAYKEHNGVAEGLILKKNLKTTDKVKKSTPNLEDIMIYYNREGK